MQLAGHHGTLAVLRHGFKCYGRTLRVAFFKPAHGMNPELAAQYAANRLGVTRQLALQHAEHERAGPGARRVNGIPVATAELKNPLTGQTVAARHAPVPHDRDPREPIFEFKRRALVHFAVDPDQVFMTTRLAGTATHFLPFNKGSDGGAGNPPDPAGRTTAPPTCGKRSGSATACWTSWRASCTCRSRRSAPTTGGRSRRKR